MLELDCLGLYMMVPLMQDVTFKSNAEMDSLQFFRENTDYSCAIWCPVAGESVTGIVRPDYHILDSVIFIPKQT